MAVSDVEILPVEDDPADAELALHALRRDSLANRIAIAGDGEEALDVLFCRGAHSNRRFDSLHRIARRKRPRHGLYAARKLIAHPLPAVAAQ
ncbi:MAG: hypothetical protein AAB225_03100 [Acidobacteriota bacterium]